MTEHKGSSFIHSCVKVPLDPYNRQPTPAYERPRILEGCKSLDSSPLLGRRSLERCSRTSSRMDNKLLNELLNTREENLQSLTDHEDIHHLTSVQFKQKLDKLKRRQRILLRNLRNCLEQADNDDNQDFTPSVKSEETTARVSSKCSSRCERQHENSTDLELKGKRCNLEQSRTNSPLLYPSGSFSCLAENQDLLTYRRNPELCRYREKEMKTLHNEKILSSDKCLWRSGSESKSPESDDPEIKVETKSLPPRSPTRWLPNVSKPFDLMLREDTNKYLNCDVELPELSLSSKLNKKNVAKKRCIRPVPLTSKIPLYDKLMAEKEERSRMVREESTLSLLSQVRPFKLECDRRALRALTRSSPELGSRRVRGSTRFKAKPVPRNLFSTDVYDRMLEEEYFRNLQKRIRASELLKSASLPPSMAKRERCRSASCLRSLSEPRSSSGERSRSCSSITAIKRGIPVVSESSRHSALMSTLPAHGTNLAAMLRAQASREKLEREIQERLEEKRREQMHRLRKTLIGRKPAWRALRFAARHEHERDLDFRTSLRRDEAREQAERHRLQMELMLDRVTRIPTLFERYSQSFQNAMRLHSKLQETPPKPEPCPKKKKKKAFTKMQSSSSTESYISLNSNNSRPSSGSLSSSSSPACLCASSMSCKFNAEKKKNNRGPLKVSINETAELIEDCHDDEDKSFSVDSVTSQAREESEKRVLNDEITGEE